MNERPDDRRPESLPEADHEQDTTPEKRLPASPADPEASPRGILAIDPLALRPARRPPRPGEPADGEQRKAHREAIEHLESERRELAALKEQIGLMRTRVEAERNTLEVERRSLDDARKSLEKDAGRLESDHGRLARLAEEFAAERETLKKTQDRLARRQEELAGAHRRLDEAKARLSEDNEQVSADPRDVKAEREQFRQQSDEVARRQDALRREQAETQVQAARLADEERLLAERNEELSRREQTVRARSDELEREQAQFHRRAAEAAENNRAEEPVAKATIEPVPAATANASYEPMPEVAATASRHKTTSATDDDFRALMSDLHHEAPPDEPETNVRTPSLERVSTETRVRVAAGRRRTAALIVSAAVVALLALGTVFVVPLVQKDGQTAGNTPEPPPTDKAAEVQAKAPEERTEPPAVAAIDAESAAEELLPPPPVEPAEPATAISVTPPSVVANEAEAEAPVPAEPEPPTGEPVLPASNNPAAVHPAPPPESPAETEAEAGVTTGPDTEPGPRDTTSTEPDPKPQIESAPEPKSTDMATDDGDRRRPAEEKPGSPIPGGLWPYRAPENLLAGPPAENLKPTLTWAKDKLGETLAKVTKAFGGKLSEPRQAIAMVLDDDLKRSLRKFAPWPYRAEVVPTADGGPRPEQVTSLVFVEFAYLGKPCLFVLKRRDADGSVVPGTPGIFVLIPGAIQEQTVVLDPTRDAIREPPSP